MSEPSPEALGARLKFDYQTAMMMRSPPMKITAYRNADDLRKRFNPINSEDEGHLATCYLVDYFIRTLIGPDEYSNETSVKIDLLANNNYPFSEPSCWVVSTPSPWSPFFKDGYPVCLGGFWEAGEGGILLGHLIVKIAKLLNFDISNPHENYGGYCTEAVNYWRTHLNQQPITPNLPYPTLPDPLVSEGIFGRVRHLLDEHIIKPRFNRKRKRSLRVFLCHSHLDKQVVHDLYHRLREEGFDPWLDEENILPGQEWEHVITKAVKSSDVVIACLSRESLNKRGFVHKEIKQALDVADEQPEGAIFLIPLLLEKCSIPTRLRRWHYVNLSEEKGYERLVAALRHRAQELD